MAAVSWAAWGRIPETQAPRWIPVALLPSLHLLVSASVVAAAPLGQVIERRTGGGFAGADSRRAAGLDAVLALLSLIFLAVHAVVIAVGTGTEIAVGPVAAALCGAVLGATGLALPLIADGMRVSGALVPVRICEEWKRSHVLGGRVMVATGTLLTVSAPVLPAVVQGRAALFATVAVAVVAATSAPFAAMAVRTAMAVRG
ncbi:SdpI family protein [Nocardiopsis suaedae]|uniref:Integral membrane protein n=1 Tax=Nocardiopsis suaedae TaxID=3018444 RepID=A0ABT4TIB8_9ACTN|nr:hypothetical protein [Nocardiopsis suaedae]MDA2804416.1 hypothetical protein [Nocardiopsis suaedae]